MPFPWLRWFGSAEKGRGGRRRSMRAQRRDRRVDGEDETPRVAPEVLAERRKRRAGIGIGASFIFVILGIVAFGYYQEFYRPPRVWAGSVRNVEFSMGDLVQRIRVLQGENRYQGGQVNLSTVPFEYLQDLINAEMLRQESPGLGINITGEDVEQELRRRFTPTAAPGQETDPGQLDREFRDRYLGYLTATGLTDGDYRERIKEELSERSLAALLSRDIETTQEQVDIQWVQIALDSQFLPNDVVQRLENEDFTRVAQELNIAGRYADPGGYVGWVPKGAFPDFDDYIFGNAEDGIEALAPGSFSEPIFTNDGFFIVKALSSPEERELEALMFLKLTSESVQKWQRDQLMLGTGQGFVRMNFNSRLYEWVTKQVFLSAPRVDRPEPPEQIVPGINVPGTGG